MPIQHIQLGDIDSTNAEALRRAGEGETGPLWVTAERQLAGRGRDGRTWISEKGNLYSSLLLPTGDLKNLPELSFVTALAVCQAVAAHLPSAAADKLSLKWPNDVLLDGQKLAGILLEKQGADALVIGCGVNVAHAPQTATALSATCLNDHARDVSINDFFISYSEAFERWFEIWRGHGFVPVRQAWLAHAHGVGCEITARLPNEEVHETFETIDDDGALILTQPGGVSTRIFAGDIFFAHD